MKENEIKQVIISDQDEELQVSDNEQLNERHDRISIYEKYKRKKWIFLSSWIVVVIILYAMSRPERLLGGIFLKVWKGIGAQDQEWRLVIWYLLVAAIGYLIIEFALQLQKQREFKQQGIKYIFGTYLYMFGFILVAIIIGMYIMLGVEQRRGQVQKRNMTDRTLENNTDVITEEQKDNSLVVVVNVEKLNVRETPEKEGRLLTKLTYGTECKVTGNKNEDGNWIEIVIPENDQTGWVCSKYVTDVVLAE